MAEGTLSIVLLGDSYTAGNGTGTEYYGKPEYHRSHLNWGETDARWLVGQYRVHARLWNLARSGDTTEGVLEGRVDKSWEAQLDENPTAIANADLIMLTIGGNDIHFSGVVSSCFAAFVRDGLACESAINEASALLDEVMNATRQIFADLEAMVDTTVLRWCWWVTPS